MFSADPITDGRIIAAIIVFGVLGFVALGWWLAGFAQGEDTDDDDDDFSGFGV